MNEGEPAKNSIDGAPRRSFLVRFAAVVCGGIVALFPFAVGLGVLIDPCRRSRRAAWTNGTADPVDASGVTSVRICSLEALTTGGVPQAFPVIADVVDGWTHSVNQRIGMIFLERTGKSKVVALNAKCPHLGCFVDFNAAKGDFECPCHASAFAKDGERLYGPSQRGMDPLEVELKTTGDQTEVFVAFQKFQAGIAERKPAG